MKTPEEWRKSNVKTYDDNGEIPFAEVDSIASSEVDKLIKAYHEYASELEREQKIEELDSIAKVNEQIISSTQQYSQGIRKAIEIIRGDGN